MLDAERLAEQMTPDGLRELADRMDVMKDPEYGTNPDTIDVAAAVLRAVANEHNWQSLDIMRETPREFGESFSTWHARCRVKILKARVAKREDVVTEDDAARAMVEMTTRDDAPAQPGSDADLIADLREQLAHLEDSARRQLFRGNSRGHWYDKAQAYGGICEEMNDILKCPGEDIRDKARELVRRVAELEAIATDPTDAIRDGIAQAFAEMPDQIYNAISEAVFSHLQKHGIQCPKSGR